MVTQQKKITLTGKPQSTNHLYKSHCRFGYPTVYMTKAGKELKESYQWEIKSQYKGELLEGDVKLKVEFYFGDKRKHDIDNYNKLIFDALSGIVYEDDNQITELCLYKFYDKENPRIEISFI